MCAGDALKETLVVKLAINLIDQSLSRHLWFWPVLAMRLSFEDLVTCFLTHRIHYLFLGNVISCRIHAVFSFVALKC